MRWGTKSMLWRKKSLSWWSKELHNLLQEHLQQLPRADTPQLLHHRLPVCLQLLHLQDCQGLTVPGHLPQMPVVSTADPACTDADV